MKFLLFFEHEFGHMINRIMQGYVAKLVTGRQMLVVNPSTKSKGSKVDSNGQLGIDS